MILGIIGVATPQCLVYIGNKVRRNWRRGREANAFHDCPCHNASDPAESRTNLQSTPIYTATARQHLTRHLTCHCAHCSWPERLPGDTHADCAHMTCAIAFIPSNALAQLAGAAFVGIFTPTVPVYVAGLSALLRIERFTLLKVGAISMEAN